MKFSKIIINKKAYHNYTIEKIFQAGLVLQGWEIKSIRSRNVNISGSYITSKNHEMYLCNALISPLKSSAQHIIYNPNRKRKLLLQKKEMHFLFEKIKTRYTLISLSLFWRKSWCKLEFGLAIGKNQKDKRYTQKKKEWKKEQLKIVKKTT